MSLLLALFPKAFHKQFPKPFPEPSPKPFLKPIFKICKSSRSTPIFTCKGTKLIPEANS